MHRILCSTGTMIGRLNGRDYRLLAPCGEKLQCDGYEFMMYEAWYEKRAALVPFLQGLGVRFFVFHCEKSIGELIAQEETDQALSRFRINCQMARELGASRMVLHLWNGIPSDGHMERHLAAYPVLKKVAQEYGVELTVENVVCSHADPLTHWRELLALDPQAKFTFDTKMAAFHNQLEAMYAPENRDLWEKHICHLHVNDYAGGYLDWQNLRTLHIGQGKIDFQRLFDFLGRVGYQGDYTVEATSFLPDGVIHWEDLNRTFRALEALKI